jgi:hypothetical protein
MNIRVTTDPMTQREVSNPDEHPCLYQGDGDNGLEIYFENEKSRRAYLAWQDEDDHCITLEGNDSEDYIAEG